MSTTVVCETISNRETTVKLSNKRMREDCPTSLKELEALELLKTEVEGFLLDHMNDYFLLRFLRDRKLNVRKAKEMLKKYVEFRKTDEYFLAICQSTYNPPMYLFDVVKVPFLQTVDYDGRLVAIAKGGHVKARELFEMVGKDECIRTGHYCAQFALHLLEENRLKTGCAKVVGIVDAEGVSFKDVYFPGCIQLALYGIKIIESIYPEVAHLGIVVNANWVVYWAYKILSPFVSRANLERLQIYGKDPDTWKPVLRKYVPENVLPEEFGGTGPPLQNATPDIFQGFRMTQTL